MDNPPPQPTSPEIIPMNPHVLVLSPDILHAIPHCFKCPLSKTIFIDPVTSPSGNTFERAYILQHLQIENTDPISKTSLTPLNLHPNRHLSAALQAYLHLISDPKPLPTQHHQKPVRFQIIQQQHPLQPPNIPSVYVQTPFIQQPSLLPHTIPVPYSLPSSHTQISSPFSSPFSSPHDPQIIVSQMTKLFKSSESIWINIKKSYDTLSIPFRTSFSAFLKILKKSPHFFLYCASTPGKQFERDCFLTIPHPSLFLLLDVLSKTENYTTKGHLGSIFHQVNPPHDPYYGFDSLSDLLANASDYCCIEGKKVTFLPPPQYQ